MLFYVQSTTPLIRLGPGGAKSSNITVDTASFEAALKVSSNSIGSRRRGGNVHGVGGEDSHWCVGSNYQSLMTSHSNNEKRVATTDPDLFFIEVPELTMSTFSTLERPFVRASVVKIAISHTLHPHSTPVDPQWLQTLAVHADVTSHVDSMDQVFEFFPHLTLCSNVWLLPEEQIGGPFCVRADALNFHSTINTHLHITQEEVVIHMWYQISERGGKIRGSDCYVPLNLNLPNFGLILPEIRNKARGKQIECSVRVVDEHAVQTEHPELIFAHSPTYRTSLQHATADFCRLYGLKVTTCYHAAMQISSCVRAKSTDAELPNIQLLPTAQDPFVFLHFEKVGGTSLRE